MKCEEEEEEEKGTFKSTLVGFDGSRHSASEECVHSIKKRRGRERERERLCRDVATRNLEASWWALWYEVLHCRRGWLHAGESSLYLYPPQPTVMFPR